MMVISIAQTLAIGLTVAGFVLVIGLGIVRAIGGK